MLTGEKRARELKRIKLGGGMYDKEYRKKRRDKEIKRRSKGYR
jgi:hypothetical protein